MRLERLRLGLRDLDPPGTLRRYYQAHLEEFAVEDAALARQIWFPFARYGALENTRATAEAEKVAREFRIP